MLNQVVLVGRITQNPEVKETESGKKHSSLVIAVPRSYKNAEGVYETDFINVTLWNMVAETTTEYCHKGDMVGIKAHVQTDSYEKDGEKKTALQIVADKVTFLTSRAKEFQEADR